MTRSMVTYVSNVRFSPGACVVVKIKLVDDFGNIVTISPTMKALNFQWKVVIAQTDGTFVSRPFLTLLTNSDGMHV